jgi:AraC-like DNA-binding protein
MRRRFSFNYLKERKHTLCEIACLLGYSEVSALNRAFRRWTGSTPSDYRRRVVSDASQPIGSAPGRRRASLVFSLAGTDVTTRGAFLAMSKWSSGTHT